MKYVSIEEYLQVSFNAFLNKEIENGDDFLQDYIAYQLERDINNLFKIYQPISIKEELHNKLTDFLQNNYYLLDRVSDKYTKEVEHRLLFLPYPKAVTSLVRERYRLDAKCLECESIPSLKSYYSCLVHFLDIKIAQCREKIINQHEGNVSVSIDDAIGAYMIYPKNKAHNIASHASVFYSQEKKHAIEVLFDEYMLTLEDIYGLPNIKVDNKGKVVVSIIPSYDLRKEFLSSLFVKDEIKILVRLEAQSIKEEEFIIQRVYKLFNYLDCNITERDVSVFLYILKKDKFKEFDFGEKTRVENKINKLFIGNKNYFLFLALLHYLKIKGNIVNADNLSKSLGGFFQNGTSLKVSTISKYLSEKDKWEVLENEHYPKMKEICFDY